MLWFHGQLPDDLEDRFEAWRSIRGDLRLIVFDAGKKLARLSAGGGLTEPRTRAALVARLERLQSWALKHGVALLCLMNTPKRGPDPATGRLFGVADAILELDRHGDRATLKVRSRDTAERTAALAFDAGLFRAVGEAQEVRYSLQRSQILEVLEAVRGPVGPSEVAGVLGLPVANVKKMMFRMARAGELKRQRRGQYALPQVEKVDARAQLEDESAKWRSPMSPTAALEMKSLS